MKSTATLPFVLCTFFLLSTTMQSSAGTLGDNDSLVYVVLFDAKVQDDNSVLLTWATAYEKNNDHFEVYRSTDLENWEFVLSQEGAGNSFVHVNYQALDEAPQDGVNYYLLKQIDVNGKEYDSEMVSIQVKNAQQIQVYPNPCNSILTISGDKGSHYVVRDVIGHVKLSGTFASSNELVSLDGLDAGRYTLVVDSQRIPFMKID